MRSTEASSATLSCSSCSKNEADLEASAGAAHFTRGAPRRLAASCQNWHRNCASTDSSSPHSTQLRSACGPLLSSKMDGGDEHHLDRLLSCSVTS